MTNIALSNYPLMALIRMRLAPWSGRRQLNEDDRVSLRNLPYVRTIENFTIVHATLEGPERWGYVFDKLAAASSLTQQNTPLCFFGHTHVPIAFIKGNLVRGGTYTKFKIEPGKRYFVNPGAVGQPRDNDPRAAYVVYEMDQGTIELRRVVYGIATTQRKIHATGLPGRGCG